MSCRKTGSTERFSVHHQLTETFSSLNSAGAKCATPCGPSAMEKPKFDTRPWDSSIYEDSALTFLAIQKPQNDRFLTLLSVHC
uniref:Uncharacterized protein n=1 Tax=Anguilla anguilla TaxID=7936 RepID=A0A0E9T949_ANGAN